MEEWRDGYGKDDWVILRGLEDLGFNIVWIMVEFFDRDLLREFFKELNNEF